MIKINLLNNQFEVPVQTEVTSDTKESVARVIKQEARKSSRRVFLLMILLMAIIGGLISLVIYRYEVVAKIEQYTGPLNILAPIQEGPTAEQLEEERRNKIRQLYMDNTIRIHRRDIQYFSFIDSLQRASAAFIRYATLDNNDYSIEFFGRSEKEMMDFTAAFVSLRTLETNKINDIERDNSVRGYRFRRVLNGTLRVPAVSDQPVDAKTSYLLVDKAQKKMQLLALEEKLSLKFSDKMKTVKGVVMTKYTGEIQSKGSLSSYTRFLNKVNQQFLNVEFIVHTVTYTDKAGAESFTTGYNILIPTAQGESESN